MLKTLEAYSELGVRKKTQEGIPLKGAKTQNSRNKKC